jgi:urea transport system permease protein
MDLTDLGAALSNSLTLSSIFILTALGLAITFGVMRVINMAHGEMLMLGAYTAYAVSTLLPRLFHGLAQANEITWLDKFAGHLQEYGLFYSIPISFLAVGLVGYLLEVGLIRFLYGRPLDTLLATWGVSLIFQQAVLSAFGADRQAMHIPLKMQGPWEGNLGPIHLPFIGELGPIHVPIPILADLHIPIYRLFLVGVTLACLLVVYLWFYRTSFGLKIRAVVQNRPMAAALGISTRRVDSLTFAFATGLAGVAGCMLAHLYNIKYNMGNDYIVEAFMVVILGGMGNLAGCVAGGLVLGTGVSFVAKFLGTSWTAETAAWLGIPVEDWTRMVINNTESLAKVLVLLGVVAVVLIRPSGLFVTRERTYG